MLVNRPRRIPKSPDQRPMSRSNLRVSVLGGEGVGMLRAEDAGGLDGRAVVIRLGLGELPLIEGHIPLVAQGDDDVGVVGTERALDAMA